jgi:type IV pilus assembly protein PilW
MTPASGVAATEVTFDYSRGVENGAVDATDHSGFKLDGGVIRMKVGDVWQPLTDDRTLTVTGFQVTLTTQEIGLSCFKPCAAGAVNCPPSLAVRVVALMINGRAANDPSVQRSVRSNVRLRNDVVTGSCPT